MTIIGIAEARQGNILTTHISLKIGRACFKTLFCCLRSRTRKVSSVVGQLGRVGRVVEPRMIKDHKNRKVILSPQ